MFVAYTHVVSTEQNHRRRKQFHFWGAERNIHCNMPICAASMNINKVSRVKHWGGHAHSCTPIPTPMKTAAYSVSRTMEWIHMLVCKENTVIMCTEYNYIRHTHTHI